MQDVAQIRERAYLDLLKSGLVLVRHHAYGGRIDLCRIEADHLHNIPTLIHESNELRHAYYIDKERGLYLENLRRFGATEYLEHAMTLYHEPWLVLAKAAGVTIEC